MKSLKGFIPAAAAALVLMASGSFADTPTATPHAGTVQQAGGYGRAYKTANGKPGSMQGNRLHQRLGDRTGNPENCPYYQERIKEGYQPKKGKGTHRRTGYRQGRGYAQQPAAAAEPAAEK